MYLQLVYIQMIQLQSCPNQIENLEDDTYRLIIEAMLGRSNYFLCYLCISVVSKQFKFYPKFFIVFHKCKCKLIETVSNKKSLELRMLNFLHFKYISRLWVFQILLNFILVINFKHFQSFSELLFHFVWQRWQILVIQDSSII